MVEEISRVDSCLIKEEEKIKNLRYSYDLLKNGDGKIYYNMPTLKELDTLEYNCKCGYCLKAFFKDFEYYKYITKIYQEYDFIIPYSFQMELIKEPQDILKYRINNEYKKKAENLNSLLEDYHKKMDISPDSIGCFPLHGIK